MKGELFLDRKKKSDDLLLPFVVMYGVCAALWGIVCLVDVVNTGGLETWKAVCAAVLAAGFVVLLVVRLKRRKK